MSKPAAYIGRFAPSPTGPLHFGSLLAAVASYLEARRHNGRWFVRVDDIDPPREQAGAAEQIIETLDAFGFEWDGPVIFQSRSDEGQRDAVRRLLAAGLAFPCGCSRRELSSMPDGPLGKIYPGTCRDGTIASDSAIRVRTTDEPIRFDDGLQGPQSMRLRSQSGDFVIRRRDGLIAYQLAVAVDDELHGITDIVRGIDLMPSTPRQIWLQRLLGFTKPRYSHIPIVVNRDGSKLSKMTGAARLRPETASESLIDALDALRQKPPGQLRQANLADVWAWAFENWDVGLLRGQTIVQDDSALWQSGKIG